MSAGKAELKDENIRNGKTYIKISQNTLLITALTILGTIFRSKDFAFPFSDKRYHQGPIIENRCVKVNVRLFEATSRSHGNKKL